MNNDDNFMNVSRIIAQTLWIASMVDGFWDRWIAHGIDRQHLRSIRNHLRSLDEWENAWSQLAQSAALMNPGVETDAELVNRRISLYCNLAQWIQPVSNENKREMYAGCIEAARKADSLSPYCTSYEQLEFRYGSAAGRRRFAHHPKGCVVIVTPLDSNKEEMFTYENDFLKAGYSTVCFDGPGQGETYVRHGIKVSVRQTEAFLHALLDSIASLYPGLPIHLFGTSSGATWALRMSSHPAVASVAAVSPAMVKDTKRLPAYFTERVFAISEEGLLLPNLTETSSDKPIWIFHGMKDTMVDPECMEQLMGHYRKSMWTVYEEEGHCCNYKLEEIRSTVCEWYTEFAGTFRKKTNPRM